MTLDEMWERLVQHQPYADQRGYGEAWAKMCRERTQESMADAADAALLAGDVTCRWSATGAAAAIQWIEKAEGKNNDT
jgi:hypothetical protein